jgi:uncharacterized membrane protein
VRTASYLLLAVAACGGGSAPAPQSPEPGDTGDTGGTGQPLVADPPALDGGAAPVLADVDPIVVAEAVSWPTDRRPAQLHFLGGKTAVSSAVAVSSDGSTPVGFASAHLGRIHAVRWRDGTLTPLPWPPSIADHDLMAVATSRNGDVVAGYGLGNDDGRTGTALVWQKDGEVAVLPTPDGLAGAQAQAVTRDGSTVVGCAGSCTRTVSWSRGTWTTVATPETFELGPNALSEDGTTFAGSVGLDGASPEGVRVGASVDRRGAGTMVSGMSDDGAVVVGSSGDRAALWRGKKLTDLGLVTGYTRCHAVAVSADGGRVVGTCVRDRDASVPGDERRFTVAFIWDKKRGIRALHDALAREHKVALPDGAWLAEANDICGYGLTVVGKASTATTGETAFMAIAPR